MEASVATALVSTSTCKRVDGLTWRVCSFTKRVVLSRRKINVKMIAMRFVGFRPEHRTKRRAGALVHAPQKLPLRC
jgi:hypothetical protein